MNDLLRFLTELATGLVLAHLIWALFYCTGTFAMTAFSSAGVPPRRLLLEGLVRTALGAALLMFAIFMLGAFGALFRKYLVALCVVLPGCLLAINLRRHGRRSTLAELRTPWLTRDVFPGIIYVLAIAVFAPTLLAPIDWDPGMYHLAHAVDWANAGRLYVDPFVRFPLFAYNFELLYAAMFSFRLGLYVQVVDWLVFLWSVLSVYALTMYLLGSKLAAPDDADSRRAQLVAFVAACVYCASPVVLRYVDTAYVDIAIGFFFVATVAAAALAIDGRDGRYAFAAAAIGGSFIGMKLQLAVFVPLLVALLAYIGVVTRKSWTSTAQRLAAFGIFGSPWYLRNVLIAGDPLSPVLNLAFRHPDPYWSRNDYAGLLFAMHGGHQPPLLAPFLQFLHPGSFAEAGAPFNICLLLAPVAVAALCAFRRAFRAAHRAYFVASASSAYAACVFYAVSQYLRYSIEFYTVYIPVLSVTVVSIITALAKASPQHPARQRIAVFGSVCVLAAMAVPSSAGSSPFQSGVTERFEGIASNVTHPDRYFAASVAGYREAVGLSDIIKASGKPGTVLALGLENLAYVFRARRVVSIGDWFGPGRYSDIQTNVDSSTVAKYLRAFDVTGVLVLQRNIGLSDLENKKFINQIESAGFKKLATVSSTVQSFARSDVIEADDARGFRNALLTGDVLAPPNSSVRFIDMFDRGRINSDKVAGTPTGRGVLKTDWPAEDRVYSAITVVSGYTYTFGPIRLGRRPILNVDVAKPLSQGQSALAWIDVTPKHGRTVRVFSATCPPADGTNPRWRHVTVKLPFRNVDATVSFGTTALPGGGIADWIAFGDPLLQDAFTR